MDKKQKAAIQKHYNNEYMQAALADKPGRRGKMARWITNPLSRRGKAAVTTLATVEIGAVVAAGIVGGVIPALIAFGALQVAKSPLDVMLGSTLIKAQRAATKAINADIDNGTLVTRYQTEVLDKQVKSAPAATVKPQNLFQRTAKQAFAKAAPATKPVRNLWHTLRHQPKL